MTFQYLTNIPLAEARSKYLTTLNEQGLTYKTENIPTAGALNRITAEAVYAKICAPHYNACAMDGIALDARITFGATETTPVQLKETDYLWVNTGDPLPEGYDAVVMGEDVVEGEGFITLYSAAIPWQNIRQIGEDISAGDMVVPSYTLLSPACLGALLAAGVLSVNVISLPLIGIIPTGNELVPPTTNPGKGDIIEFNSTIFGGMMVNWGCTPKIYPIVKDEAGQIESTLTKAVAECDVVILNAGSSAGSKDFSTDAIHKVGKVVLHGVAIKPGKPAILGYGRKGAGQQVVPIIGLPGYPVSGILVLEQIFKPVIERLTGKPPIKETITQAISSRRITSSLKYLEFIRARLGNVGGRIITVPLNRGAGVVSSFVKADGIIQIPQDSEGIEVGEPVNVEMIKDIDEINRTLVITGSHDPLLDEITDIMTRTWRDTSVASAHVGSLGGIMAVRRNEAHMGGIHLLDEASGSYNIPYVNRYFPEGGVALIRCVERTQGIMVPAGNPKKVRGVTDLVGLNYVNRQKGSGTRILIDYLIKQNGIESKAIPGYEREEFTHTAVAAAIAANTADAGMGILSAAKIYGLDFIPVTEEQYDLLISEEALALEPVQRLLGVLQGREFANRIMKLGGYRLTQPGERIL